MAIVGKPQFVEKFETTLKNFLSKEANVNPETNAAYNKLLTVGMPTNRHEDWKISPLRQLYTQPPTIPTNFDDENAIEHIKAQIKDKNVRIVLVNGRFNSALSSDLASKGICVRTHPVGPLSNNANGFDCLQNLLSSFRIEINLEKEIYETVNIIYCNQESAMVASDVQLCTCSGSKFNIVEEDLPLFNIEKKDSHIANPSNLNLQKLNLSCGKGSNVKLCYFSSSDNNQTKIKNRFIKLSEGSNYEQFDLLLDCNWLKQATHTYLEGENSNANLNSLTLNDEKAVIENFTRTHHLVPNCNSEQLHKNLGWSESQTLFDGLITVAPIAQKTDAQMSNHNLLLSNNARVFTKPQLEIFADDVACTHGVTSGQLDNDALFYLRTRGFDEIKAKKLLVSSFAYDAVPRWVNGLNLLQEAVDSVFKKNLI